MACDLKKAILLCACVAMSLCCQATQAKENESLPHPIAFPAPVPPHPIMTTGQALPAGKQLLIRTQLAEVSLTKIRRLGIDLATSNEQKIVKRQGSETFFLGNSMPPKFVDALCQNKLAKILAESTIAMRNGGPVSLSMGSEVPFPPQPNGKESEDAGFVFIGTQLDFHSCVVQNQKVLIDLCLDWSALETDRTGASQVRRVKLEGAVEAKLGETTVLYGLRQIVRQGEQEEEVTLVLTMTPELIDLPAGEKRASEDVGQATAATTVK